jgi:hypothetical protein
MYQAFGKQVSTAALGLLITIFTAGGMALEPSSTGAQEDCAAGVCIADLRDLSVASMRQEAWRGQLAVLTTTPALRASGASAMHGEDSAAPNTPAADPAPPSILLRLISDNLRQYVRLDLPAAPTPPGGHPLVVFLHGWVGKDAAPEYALGARPGSMYRDLISRFTAAGFAVASPGFRGHGTVDSKPAEGLEFLHAWDTGSYLSPIFYARDVLNLLAALPSLPTILADNAQTDTLPTVDSSAVAMIAHSQGGDVLLTVLAVAGTNSRVATPISAASIWAGNIADRFTQAETFGPMGSSLQAFMAGDGNWTGTAVGRDGTVNRDFVFPWPPHWINTVDRSSAGWGWQEDTWSTPTVELAIEQKYTEMYTTINRYVNNIDDAAFSITRDAASRLRVNHDPRVNAVIPGIGGFNQAQYLTQPLNLHFSDRDYYSLPDWNRSLAARIKLAGGQANAHEYSGNTHSLTVSEHPWYSPPGTTEGASIALERDATLFHKTLRLHKTRRRGPDNP